QIRPAATKAIALLQTTDKNWVATQQCGACHHYTLPSIALGIARTHGVPVNDDTLRHIALKGNDYMKNLDWAIQGSHVIDPMMSDGFGMIAAQALGVEPNVTMAAYARLIARRQMPEGYWMTFDSRPPQSY